MKLADVPILIEGPRGCGFRKAGGLYLMADGPAAGCGKLPIALTVCPTCGAGIKPSRGWTWFQPAAFVAPGCCGAPHCGGCPLGEKPVDRAGLLWIGAQFYPTPGDWLREAETRGISRRIPAVPKDFILGETWVFVAHRAAVPPAAEENGRGEWKPGIFHVFLPRRVEYVVRGDETEEELDRLVDRGISPVRVEPIGETALFGGKQGGQS